MAFRASNALPAKALDDAKTVARSAKQFAQGRSAAFASGATALDVLQCRDSFVRLDTELATAASTPGIAAYAQEQENDENYDIAAEFTALRAAVQAVVSNIESAMPADGDDYLLTTKFTPGGGYTYRAFTGPQLATLRGLLDAVAAQVS